MIVEFDKSFERSLRKINDPLVLKKLKRIIILIENSPSILFIPNVKKLSGFSSYYRVRIGDYRAGFEMINNSTIRFIIIAHRKDVYNIFP